MAVTSFYTVDGEILGERGSSGRTDYGADDLGSTISAFSGDTVVDRYAYSPFGNLIARSGTGQDPAFLWLGAQGYRPVARANVTHYVRARHYSRPSGTWTTTRRNPLSPPIAFTPATPTLESGAVDWLPVGKGNPLVAGATALPASPTSYSCTWGATSLRRRLVSSYISVVPLAPGSWKIEAYVAVRMYCTVACSCCSNPPPTPDMDIVQWITGHEYLGAHKTNLVDYWDDTQVCKQTKLDNCTYALEGVDAPGLGALTLGNSGDPCDYTKARGPQVYGRSDTPIDIEDHFRTCCGAPPPPSGNGKPTCQQEVRWGYSIAADEAMLNRKSLILKFYDS